MLVIIVIHVLKENITMTQKPKIVLHVLKTLYARVSIQVCNLK